MSQPRFEGRTDGTALEIYGASAGSGKTYTLVKSYLRIALAFPTEWTAVLVITFTRKAAAELKDRIVSKLVELSECRDARACEAYAQTLADELAPAGIRVTAAELLANAPKVLRGILFGYDRFWVSTIDAFVQRVVRSFAHETGLKAGLSVELDADRAAGEAAALLLEQLREDDLDLTRWLTDMALANLAAGRRWDVRPALKRMAAQWLGHELRRFDMRMLPPRHELLRIGAELDQHERFVRRRAGDLAREVFVLMDRHGLTIDDFSYKSAGALGYFKKLQAFAEIGGEIPPPGKRLLDAARDGAGALYAKSTPSHVVQRIEACFRSGLESLIREAANFADLHLRNYYTVAALKENFGALGVAADLYRTLEEFRKQGELMMISDASELMNQIHRAAGAPLLYEKIGAHLRHVFIDEFQDTSVEQWENLRPLMWEGAAAGGFNYLVGDVKQSIYRWRGGDMNLIMREAESDFRGMGRVKRHALSVNYRSRAAVVEFNNLLFEALAAPKPELSEAENRFLAAAYGDVRQSWVLPGGKVVLRFFHADQTVKTDADDEADVSLALKCVGEEIVNSTRPLGDFAVLVRTRDEGRKVVEYLNSLGIASVSDESSEIGSSVRVRLCVAALRRMYGDASALNDAEAAFALAREAGDVGAGFAASRGDEWRAKVEATASRLWGMGLYSTLRAIVDEWGLDASDAFVGRFLDAAMDFEAEHGADVPRFLEWFEEKGRYTGVSVAGGEAVRVMTIHKSKGLEFPVVVAPFAHWDYRWKGNQAPTVWVASAPAFQELGMLGTENWIWPVKMVRRVLETPFAQRYEQEAFGYFTEALNLLYVALTRARDELYVFANARLGVGRWLYSARETTGLSRTQGDTYVRDLGVPETPTTEAESRPWLRTPYPLRPVPMLIRPSISYALLRRAGEEGATAALEHLRRADLMKNYLISALHRLDERPEDRIRAVVEGDLAKGRITPEEADGFEAELYEALNAPPFEAFRYWRRSSVPFVLGRRGYCPSVVAGDATDPTFRALGEIVAVADVAGPFNDFVAALGDSYRLYAFVYEVSTKKTTVIADHRQGTQSIVGGSNK
jgi:ATP-dependent exoDNAse (exonuclease V) beta subunit